MKLLAIDTSGAALGAAIVTDTPQAGVLGSFSVHTGKNHSLALLPMLDAMLANCGLKLADMDAFAVTVGPGSFTGLRIGIATVKAWAQALGKPLVAVSSTAAMARAAGVEGWVCPIFDARRNEVYCALFRDGLRQSEDRAIAPQQLLDELLQLDAPVLLAGDALPVYGAQFAAVLGSRYRTLPAERTCFMAEAAAMLALEKYHQGEFTPLQELLPVYLRLSEAEEKRAAALAAQEAEAAHE